MHFLHFTSLSAVRKTFCVGLFQQVTDVFHGTLVLTNSKYTLTTLSVITIFKAPQFLYNGVLYDLM